MMRLTLPTPLISLIRDFELANSPMPKTVLLDARSWPEFIGEMHERFPFLAERVLTASGALTSGFILVINDEARPVNGTTSYDLQDGDQIALIAALAGG
jgi:molybdopterin converting factor small subunit